MRIEINEKFVIDIDNYSNHTLMEIGTIKTGKNAGQVSEMVIGYYNNIPAAVRKYVFLTAIRGVEKDTLLGYVERFEKIEKDIVEKLGGIDCRKGEEKK
jgi:hypothetical protein